MMRWLKVLTAGAVVAGAALLIPAWPAAATSHDATYSFNLGRGDTAVAPVGGTMAAAGDSIKVTGSGRFDVAAGTVHAKGTFVHYTADGTVICKGTWQATAYTSFVDFGTDENGETGGVLAIVVTHYCTSMGMTMAGIPMTVTSTVDAPPGYVAGITVCDFTQPTGGTVAIEPEQ